MGFPPPKKGLHFDDHPPNENSTGNKLSTMKYAVLLAIFMAIVASAEGKKVKILAIGDSITAGGTAFSHVKAFSYRCWT